MRVDLPDENIEKLFPIESSWPEMDDSVLYVSTGVQVRCVEADVVGSQMKSFNFTERLSRKGKEQ